jgi:two-component system, chemotaxis family, chemotaxis protein CheY
VSALGSLQVLLVDDNPHMRSIVVTILKGVGVKSLREASHGAEALQALRDFPADLAIVDFNMQPLDGVQFTRLVRNAKDSPNPYLPIIMMTGHAERSRVMEARNAGVTEFVVKPVTAKSVLSRIQAVIFKPRPFVRTDDYFGPCRRRLKDERYAGPFRRSEDAHRSSESSSSDSSPAETDAA